MENRGQINSGIVWTIVIMMIAVSFGALIFGKVNTAALEQAEETRTHNTYATLNSDFADNDSENCPAYWDNSNTTKENWNQVSGYVADNADNATCTWYQSLTVGAHDGVESATITAKFKLYDNINLTTYLARVILERDGTDNTVIWQSSSTENSTSYTSIDNDAADYITTAGTYRIILLDNGSYGGPIGTPGNTLETRWDDVKLTVTTYDSEVAEDVVVQVGTTGSTIFPLILLLVLIGVFVAIIGVLKVLG